ncbi:MAG: GC-type dockerin domain-anchored protein [Planctomycetota bacterium]
MTHTAPAHSFAAATAAIFACLTASAASAQPFATEVVDYSPAPGQFVTNPDFNDPNRALGPPVGGGPLAPNNTSLVSLGGVGGFITLKMPRTVIDDPRNRLGLDAIVFGNAFYVSGDPTRRFAEPGLIEIALDANTNGIADDPFFPIAGSDGTTIPFPPNLNGPILEPPPGFPPDTDFIFGYADATPTSELPGGDDPARFYTIPDDPNLIDIDALTDGTLTAGGDAFDIAWAVIPGTTTPANLTGFDFIRITTGPDVPAGIFGEVSTEIDAVADARPLCPADTNGDGQLTPGDFNGWVLAFNNQSVIADQNDDGQITPGDFNSWILNFNQGCNQ